MHAYFFHINKQFCGCPLLQICQKQPAVGYSKLTKSPPTDQTLRYGLTSQMYTHHSLSQCVESIVAIFHGVNLRVSELWPTQKFCQFLGLSGTAQKMPAETLLLIFVSTRFVGHKTQPKEVEIFVQRTLTIWDYERSQSHFARGPSIAAINDKRTPLHAGAAADKGKGE